MRVVLNPDEEVEVTFTQTDGLVCISYDMYAVRVTHDAGDLNGAKVILEDKLTEDEEPNDDLSLEEFAEGLQTSYACARMLALVQNRQGAIVAAAQKRENQDEDDLIASRKRNAKRQKAAR